MPPCKRCSAARLPSRDDLLVQDDGDLVKMKDSLSKEVEDLEEEVKGIKKKNEDELGKLKKRLDGMNADYKKFGEDSIARTAKFDKLKAKAKKDFSSSLEDTDETHKEIAKLYASMNELRKYLNPYVDKLISGDGWPKGCKCAKAKALLQHLEGTLRLASVDLSAADTEDSGLPTQKEESLLRRSSKISNSAYPQEKYKLVREVQQLAEKRAKLMEEKTLAITGFSEQQRITLDRINVVKTKSNLKSTTERKYKDNDDALEKQLKSQVDSAKSYLDSGKAQLERLKKNEADSMKVFKSFKAELQKCKCI